MVSPVDLSASSGALGVRSLGRRRENARSFEPMSLAALAAISAVTTASSYWIGGLERVSAPPAITMSASPIRMAFVPSTIAWVDVAHARLTEKASIERGSAVPSTISRAMFGAVTSATTAP